MSKMFEFRWAPDSRRCAGPTWLSLLLAVSLSTRCTAAKLSPDSATPTPATAITSLPIASISNASSITPPSPPAQPDYTECLTLLRDTEWVGPALVEAVTRLFSHPEDASQAIPPQPPLLMAVTFRENAGQVRDTVVQACYGPLGTNVSPNVDGHVQSPLGGELAGSADQFLGLMYQRVAWFGPKESVQHRQRAFQAALKGDMTLLHEETIEPLRLLVVMPHGGTFLPTMFRSRVVGLVLDARLEFGTWSGRVAMVTSDGQAAEQVATVLSAWRDIAMSLVETFGSGGSGKVLRQSLEASTVQVVANRVLASAAVDSSSVARATRELFGYSGGCPPGGVCSNELVAVCHKQTGQPHRTLCVPPSAVADCLAAGDTCGPCAGGR